MADFPSWKELFDIAKNTILINNQKISQEAIETPGTNANIIVAMMATVADEVVRQIAVAMQRAIPSLASGNWLDRLAWDWFGMTRNPATFATATVSFTRSDSSSSYTLPAGTRVTTADGSIGYLTDADIIFPAGVATADAQVTCEYAGSIGNVEAGAITVIQSPTPGQTFTLSSQAAAGGNDEETDERLRWRMRNYWASAQRGTLAAIEYGAKQVPGITMAVATESEQSCSGYDYYSVDLIVADDTGNCTAQQQTDVENEIVNWRPCGVKVNVLPGEVQWQPIHVTISVYAGYNTTEVTRNVRQALVSLVNSLKINQTLRLSAINETCHNIDGVADINNIEPTTDVVPGPGKTLRTTIDRITVGT